MPHPPTDVATRFWSKVDKSGDCWIWRAARDRRGYGKILDRRHLRAAHRVAYELTVGPIPAGLAILHRCDTPACVRPAHLWAGTLSENQADAVAKGRQRPWSEKGWHQTRDAAQVGK